jgi:NDP-sugar pyrophosphorylase family protein
MKETKEISAIYMVAGLSKRFGGKPKMLAKIGPEGESFIKYSIDRAIQAGVTKIILVVSERTKPLLEEEFGNNYENIPVLYALQKYNPEKRDKPWGTGDAACSGAHLVEGPCLVCNGDDLYGEEDLKTIVNHLKNTNEDATMALKLKDMVPEEGEVTRGVFETKDNYLTEAREVFGISKSNYQEKGLTENSLVNTNLFGLQPLTLQKLSERVDKFKGKNQHDRKIECFIHVELANIVKTGDSKMRVYVSDEPWFGITNPEDEEKMRQALKR